MYQSIIVAVDDSAPSGRAAAAAGELAKLSGGRVVVFHAREHQDVIGKSGGTFDLEYPEEALAIVENAAAAVRAQGVPVTWTIMHASLGHVAAEIVTAAGTESCDTIVVGSHGRSGIAAAFLGSTADKVLHLADRPVLVIR
jgi:nucleotide-binding universal stress UspA family protein